jgi:predicted ATP-dependent serine protease
MEKKVSTNDKITLVCSNCGHIEHKIVEKCPKCYSWMRKPMSYEVLEHIEETEKKKEE